VLAPVWGPLSPEFKPPVANGSTPSGCIVAFKVEDQNGKPVLTPAWVSRDVSSPLPTVIASGVVFALSSGDFGGRRSLGGSHATLYALDAATGKELYSSRNLVTAPAALTGMTLANGRVYFGTTDGTAYAFGMYLEH
jgi:outer membrane protein assembly factor BamB